MKIFLSFVTVLVLLGGCSQTGTFETELMQLGYQEKTILCTLEVLHSRISNEWDGINALLEANLPPDMPKEEKFNMLNVRNANLIRMFESFQTIDPEIKQALDTVEQADVDMRKEILA
ncbi:MAG: hypothetical protein H6569_10125 [Lewinellaceae bacterium]|nr:hypothetical protein [Lewinellaceae bacterium]